MMKMDLNKLHNRANLVIDNYFNLCVTKDIYDKIRTHKGTFIIGEREYNLIEFDTHYIGLGKDFIIDIGVKLEETLESIRGQKLNDLGI